MYHNLFRITLLVTAIATGLTACSASTPIPVPATEAPVATEAVSTATEIAPTNTLEPTATQVVLGVVTGRIAFQSNRDGNNEIYIMNGDGSGLTNLTNNPADDSVPAWSPDGKKIAFSSNRDGNIEIYLMNADGSSPTRLTDRSGEISGLPGRQTGKRSPSLVTATATMKSTS
jgi:dipeptidyl aminopeptidase/acylaminoacyl peptidase